MIGPLLRVIFGEAAFGKDSLERMGMLTADGYNSFGAMHGTMMVFFGIVPTAFAAFGNFVVPLQIGAPDMTFPRINMASYWSLLHQLRLDDGQLLCAGRRREVRLDVVSAAGRASPTWDRASTLSGTARPSGWSGWCFNITGVAARLGQLPRARSFSCALPA